MRRHVCPPEISSAFRGASEQLKRALRRSVILWLVSIHDEIRPGDVVMVPDPDTGELVEVHKATAEAAVQ